MNKRKIPAALLSAYMMTTLVVTPSMIQAAHGEVSSEPTPQNMAFDVWDDSSDPVLTSDLENPFASFEPRPDFEFFHPEFQTTVPASLSRHQGRELAAVAAQSPWQSCKGITVVSADKFAKYGMNGQSAGNVQKMPDFGLFKNMSLDGMRDDQDKKDIKGFLDLVVQQYKSDREKNLALLQVMEKCYDSGDKSGHCSKIRAAVANTIATYAPQMKLELALSYPGDLAESLAFWNNGKVSVNKNLRDRDVFRNHPFAKTPLTDKELVQAKALMEREEKVIERAAETRAKKIGTENQKIATYDEYGTPQPTMDAKDYISIVTSVIRSEYRTKHQERYRRLMYEKAPLFMYLDAADHQSQATGVPDYSDRQIRNAVAKHVEAAKEEIARTQRSLNRGVISFNRILAEKGSLVPLPKLIHSFLQGERDELDYLGFNLDVEQVLRAHPQYCGIATGLTKYEGYQRIRDFGAIIVGTLVAAPAVGAVVAAGAPVVGIAVTAAEVTVAGAILFDGAMVAQSYKELQRTEQTFAGRTGTDSRESGPSRGSKAMDEAVSNVTLSAASFAFLDIGVSAGVGKYAFSAARNAILGEDVASQVARAANASGATKRAEVFAAQKAVKDKVLGNSDETVSKGLLARYMRSAPKDGNMTPAQESNLWKGWEISQMSKAGMDPGKLAAAEATARVFESANKSSLLGWSQESHVGFEGVMTIFHDDLVTHLKAKFPRLAYFEGKTSFTAAEEQERVALRVQCLNELKSLLSDQEKTVAQMKSALKRAGVEDETLADRMARCPFGWCGKGNVCAAR